MVNDFPDWLVLARIRNLINTLIATASEAINRVADWPGKPGNDREFFLIFNKKRFQFVLNVLHKVIYL